MDTRRKNKAQEKKSNKKTEVQESNNISSAEININSIENHHLKIESKLKGIIENFINQEIKKNFNLIECSNKKIKNHYEFGMKLTSEEDCDKIMALFFNHSEFRDKKEIKIFKNNKEINQSETEDLKKAKEKKEETKNKNANENLSKLQNNINISELLSNQITIENLPESLDKDKIFEIFFIYGDILEIILKKEEKKALIAFKFVASVDKALRKFNESQKNFKSFSIRKSFVQEKIENLKEIEIDKQHFNSQEVIYVKFIDGSIIDFEEMKKVLKKYGEVLKISRKIEGRSYFILFKEENVGAKIVKDFKKGLFSIKNIDATNLIIDFACNKIERENKKEAETKKEQEKQIQNSDKTQEKENETQTKDSNNKENNKKSETLIEQQTNQITNQTQNSTEDNILNINTNNNNKINDNQDTTKNLTNNNVAQQQEPQSQFESLDINKFWQTFFDPTYNRNYYYNPFLNESVWELPPGACAQDLTSQLEPTQINLSSSYQQNSQNLNQQINNQQSLNANYDPEDNLSQGSYYDEEAWEEDELREKLVWDKLKAQQLKDWMARAARQQVSDTRRDTAYIEGNYDYNIWYDKYLTDRKEEKEKIPAMHKCEPALDTGYTKADLQEKEGGAFFCLYFAKGCCSEGVNCRYYHRIPTKSDAEKIENLRDVFGRSRFATHRSDMGGVGTFTRDCRTLYVSDLKMVDSANPIKDMIRIIYDNFSPWGEIEDINYIPTKAACFIRFSHRCFAEFAKEAMMDQSLVGEEILGVKWAFDDPNPLMKKKIEKEHENRFLTAHLKRQENRNELLRKKRNNPNSDYFGFYNNRNNPYASAQGNNQFGYDSGYGYDDSVGGNAQVAFGYGYNSVGEDQQHQQITNNCVKLSETLRMIDENFNNQNN